MHCQNLGPEAQLCVCSFVFVCVLASVPWPSSLPVLGKLPIVVIFLFRGGLSVCALVCVFVCVTLG